MTTRDRAGGPDTGQYGLFGDPAPAIPSQRGPSRMESNDVELMVTVAANAVRCGYLLVGAAERVYTRTHTDDRVARVPRYEEDAVHQLLRRRWLTRGSAHDVTCGAAHLVGTAVLVPKQTRDRIARWNRLQRPPSWPDQQRTPRGTPEPGVPPDCELCHGTGRVPYTRQPGVTPEPGMYRPDTSGLCPWCHPDI